ncbi:MAG: hypothetical protein ACREQI_07065 [Candidatus Binataceae bacterium]
MRLLQGGIAGASSGRPGAGDRNQAPKPKSSYNVLFLCADNSAKSLIAEALLKRWGAGEFRAFSAGIEPKA